MMGIDSQYSARGQSDQIFASGANGGLAKPRDGKIRWWCPTTDPREELDGSDSKLEALVPDSTQHPAVPRALLN